MSSSLTSAPSLPSAWARVKSSVNMSASTSGGAALGQDAVFVAVTLEDGLDDQLPGVARHRLLERGQRGGDHRLDLVGLAEQIVDGALRRLSRHDPDLEEHVLLAGEVEVEQRLRHTCRGADLGDGGAGVALGAPQRHRRLYQHALGLVRPGSLKGCAALTTVSS